MLSSAVPDYVRVIRPTGTRSTATTRPSGARQPRPRRGMITRPSVAEVSEYRRQVDAAMDALFDSFGQHSVDLAAEAPISPNRRVGRRSHPHRARNAP